MRVAKVLTIATTDSGGGAGVQADLKAISALGGYGMSVIAALTAQNTIGVQGIHKLPVEFIEQQFDSVAKDIGIDSAKIGMLFTSEIMRSVARKIREYQLEKLVIDPVMVAKSGAMLIQEDAKQTLVKELLPIAFVITPNLHEAEVLTGMKIVSTDDMKDAARMLHRLGAKNVLVKGGHLDGDALDILYDGEHFCEFISERISTKDTHGTGCTLSAAIATGLAQGKSVVDAVQRAKEYVTTAIRFSLRIGGGHGPTNHFAELFRESGRFQCLEDLKHSARRLERAQCGHLIPEIQSNLGYALPYATQLSEVAAFPGRLIRIREDVKAICDPEFGASRHVAKIILTVMRYYPEYRAAMAVRFSEEILTICQKIGFTIGSFDRQDEPEAVKRREGSSLEWGTNQVLSQRKDVPDMIFDRGEVGKEPVIRVLGKTPAEVVDKVFLIAQTLKNIEDEKGRAEEIHTSPVLKLHVETPLDESAFDESAKDFDEWFGKNKAVFESELLAEQQFITDPERTVSIGLGSGLFDARLGIKFGVEPSESMAALARKRGIDVKIGSAENVPFEDEQFNAVLLGTIISYVKDRLKAVSEAHRILRQGGHIIVSFLTREGSYGMLYDLAYLQGKYDPETAPQDPYPIQFLQETNWCSVSEVSALLKDAGFVGLEYMQTLTRHPKYSNDSIEEPTSGYDRGDYVVIRGRKP